MTEEQYKARWGISWLDAWVVSIPRAFFDHYVELGISGSEFMFILHLAAYGSEPARGAVSPSLGVIAAKMGITTRQVRRLRQSLEKAGWLIVHERVGETSLYDLGVLSSQIGSFLEECDD